MHNPTAVRKRKTATATPATAPTNSTEDGANQATGAGGTVHVFLLLVYRWIITAHVL